MPDSFPQYSTQEIVALRPDRATLDPRRPYNFFVEREHNATGTLVDVATLFLTNRECPFRCLMCDLWKQTLVESVSPGDIPEQIRWGLRQLSPAREIKLYNSGNFFDPKAIPPDDYPEIAELVRTFDNVIVENHPNLCHERCLEFRDLIAPATLEIALGLETCHPQVLESLNKQMTLNDFERATTFLHAEGIQTRTFLLLKPPFLNESEAVEWTLKSLDYAFDCGVSCCAVIPTRAGNGMMDRLQTEGAFAPPRGDSLETVLEEGLRTERGRVFVDLWDVEAFFPCHACRDQRLERLNRMNLHQILLPPISCAECGS
ncbi:MAG: radical SAM protein [Planctomycetaceae bacterium]|nr:radical SAM protein [Planctomycetaceae bacterium]